MTLRDVGFSLILVACVYLGAYACELFATREWRLVRWAWEWKAEDLWIGVFWRRSLAQRHATGDPPGGRPVTYVDVWLCLLPCLPIHLTYRRLPR